MMYPNTVKGKFLDRSNRFVAHVELNGGTETVHVKNTGRCRELLLPGVEALAAHGVDRNSVCMLEGRFERSVAYREMRKYLLEVKGCTLEIGGVGYFPDAPTERGVKHIRELIEAKKRGYWCGVAFVIQMNGVREVRPNTGTHPEFGEALADAEKAGVHVLHLPCDVKENSLSIQDGVRFPA